MSSNVQVYLHYRNDTNEVFYVGIGRGNRPRNKRNRNIHWKNIVNKFGYTVKILAKNLSWINACKLEIALIKKYGRKDLGLGNLVNLTNGGDENPMLGKKGELCPFYGKSHSKRTLKIMSENRRVKIIIFLEKHTRKKQGRY